MRTDEGVCPYMVATYLIEETPFSKRRGRSFDARKASLRYEETPSSKRRRRLFVFSPAVPANKTRPHYTETILHEHSRKALFQTDLIIILNYEL